MNHVAPPPADAPALAPTSPSSGSWDEAERLRALLRYDILDTPRERDFDDIAAMAAEICDTPIAVVNLVATDRQWFKAEVGIGADSTPLDSSFCVHAILQPGMTEIPDARDDPRFACNPLVTPESGIRFYAGALLETPEGLPLGTVCVLDIRPRTLTDLQRRTLSRLARQVMIQLELRRALRDRAEETQTLRDTEERLHLAQEAGGIGAFEIDVATNTLLASPRFRALYGHDPDDEMTPASIRAQVLPEDWAAVTNAADRAAGRVQGTVEFRIRRADTGEERWLSRNGEIVRDAVGNPLRLRGVIQDITGRKRAEDRQRLLMGELLHRVKNNLALIQAVAAQTFRNAPSLEAARVAFGARLRALARAHDVLGEGQAADTTIGDVVRGMVALHAPNVARRGDGMSGDSKRADAEGGQDAPRITGDGPPVRLGASPALALALHELATNAAKYGALSTPGGRVAVSWRLDEPSGGKAGPDRLLRLRWEESGGPAVARPTRRGFGSRLIEENLRRAWHGTATLRFPPTGVVLEAAAPLAALIEEDRG